MLFPSLSRWSPHSFTPSTGTCLCLTDSSTPWYSSSLPTFQAILCMLSSLGNQYSSLILGWSIISSCGLHPDPEKPLFFYRLGFRDQKNEAFFFFLILIEVEKCIKYIICAYLNALYILQIIKCSIFLELTLSDTFFIAIQEASTF